MPLLPRLRPLLFLLGLWLLVLAPTPAEAASVTIRVVDRDGRPLEGELLFLEPQTPALVGRGRPARGFTDREGLAMFEGLPPGEFVVRVFGPRRPGLARPEFNPLAPPPKISLLDPDEARSLEVTLWPGKLVRSRLDLPDGAFSGFTLMMEHQGTGQGLTLAYRDDSDSLEAVLPEGLWRVFLKPRPGYLLVGLDVDGRDSDGHVAMLDLTLLGDVVDLTWTFAALSRVTGSLHGLPVPAPLAEVVATLEQPGPWIESARRRGGSVFETVSAVVDGLTSRYEMVLPDGVWRLRPQTAGLKESEPEFHQLELAPGDEAEADFSVRVEGQGSGTLFVRVQDDRGRRIPGARVEVFPVENDGASPFASATVTRFGTAQLQGVPDGDLLVLASHVDTLEGEAEVIDFRAGRRPQPRPVVVVPRGGEIVLESIGLDEEPKPGVNVSVRRLGDPPATKMLDATLRQARLERSVDLDQTGRGVISGLYPGTYRLRAEATDAASLLRIGPPEGELVEELDVLISRQRLELEVREVAAARFEATLQCSDGQPLPPVAAVRVVPHDAQLPRDPTGVEGPSSGILLTEDRLALGGEARDQLTVGPLLAGAYRLAVRPMGFARWTWGFETHDAGQSEEIAVAVEVAKRGEAVPLGGFRLDCAPAMDVIPEVPGGSAFPDLSGVETSIRFLHPEEDHDVAQRPRLEARSGRIQLRDLAEVEGRLELTLTHPHFLPTPSLSWLIPVEPLQGGFEEVIVELEALGGAIEIKSAPPKATRLEARSLEISPPKTHTTEISEGKGLLPSLQPGVYTVTLRDPEGTELKTWPQVEVKAGATVQPPPLPSTPPETPSQKPKP